MGKTHSDLLGQGRKPQLPDRSKRKQQSKNRTWRRKEGPREIRLKHQKRKVTPVQASQLPGPAPVLVTRGAT